MKKTILTVVAISAFTSAAAFGNCKNMQAKATEVAKTLATWNSGKNSSVTPVRGKSGVFSADIATPGVIGYDTYEIQIEDSSACRVLKVELTGSLE